MGPLRRQVFVMGLQQPAHQCARLRVTLVGPFPGQGPLRVGQIASQHGCQAEDVAAPIELPRRRQIATAAHLQRVQQAW
jgi:hypothetical protein